MTRTVGLAISRTRIVAVVLRGRRVTWAGERTITEPSEIPAALADLVVEGPSKLKRARVVLEGEAIQLKLLAGLPRLTPTRLRRAVALQATRFFLRNGAPLTTTAVRLESGHVLAAAADAALIDVVVEGCSRVGLRVAGLGVGIGACAGLLPDGDRVLVADAVVERVTVVGGVITAVRRTLLAESPHEDSIASNATAPGFGGMDGRFLTAYAAARCDPAPSFETAWGHAGRKDSTRRATMRLARAGVALWMAAAVVVGVRVSATVRRSEAERVALAPALEAAMAVERDLALADDLLGAVHRARAARSWDAGLLSALTAALPDSAHLGALRRNRDGRVTLIGYAPSAARVLGALAPVPGVTEPALAGGITVAAIGGQMRERFEIGLRWVPEVAR